VSMAIEHMAWHGAARVERRYGAGMR
jgi:hypothetical protein